MNVVKTDIPDVLIFEPKIFCDDRGFFFESFNQKVFEEAVGYDVHFVQDNHSKSSKNVLRGLHYQTPPYAQAKLVRCIRGKVYDVAVDIRKASKTYGKWVGVILSEENKRQLWIPEGFAHGFLVLSESAEFVYKTTNFYNKNSEAGLKWNDPYLNIQWPIDGEVLLSEKDAVNKSLREYEINEV
ncbi:MULTISPECIES: dTDP-4-dehydrorhamnose 3,5-epimerase [Enterobacter]|nr:MULTISPECIES: dTDP-4-dehydrorhamnose 3,5-epimerase [Enterobacter]ELC7251770.1 dTDP-4-dehydrorhamnose 3,5-epimerase [Enterobacter hormaechei]EUM31237.1 dTDP-4-dehydrorhamnose 3,5-epimerase [Enterobacter hormaechei]KAA0848424.1 dTDP-4-dehydrorhamnose 3,5-epimerase [Enterobacter hormaechei]MBK4667683.1 dTDP-4-dehydrorhamnose 3,5-epimerase [Enterobacter hormaechei]MCE1213841.1 dTDP-4-dehydrorhamnose 3,5-epimerase [Enterobacter hormaechei]